MRHRWTFVLDTGKVQIHVDYRARLTKVTGSKYISYHEGIYPNQDPYPTKRFRV